MQKFKPLLFAFVSWFLLLAVLHLPVIKDFVRYVMVSITHFSAIVTGKLLFLPVADKGYPVMDFAGFGMQVILECTAYNFYLFVLMITLFAPWTKRQKLINFAVFAGVIFITNNLRFLIMGAIGRYYPALFGQIHDYLWNILFAILVFMMFLWADSRSGNQIFSTAK
ncbi:MAG: archaeosortase/exosortase family protein [Bacteroidales bacterium]|nr:archaeosortase/exosortase family protein [Bacteroidales bacterium]